MGHFCMWTKLISKATAVTGLSYYKYIKMGVIAAIFIALTTWVVTYHNGKVDAAYTLGGKDQVIETNNATAKVAKEISDEGKKIRNSIAGSSIIDNLSLLFSTTIIVPDDNRSEAFMQSEPQSTGDDIEGSGDSGGNESSIYQLDNRDRARPTPPREGLPDSCYKLDKNAFYGYSINPICEERS